MPRIELFVEKMRLKNGMKDHMRNLALLRRRYPNEEFLNLELVNRTCERGKGDINRIRGRMWIWRKSVGICRTRMQNHRTIYQKGH